MVFPNDMPVSEMGPLEQDHSTFGLPSMQGNLPVRSWVDIAEKGVKRVGDVSK